MPGRRSLDPPPPLGSGPARASAPPGADSLGVTSIGLDPRTAAALSYVVGWLSGLLFYVLERENTYVRFHAMQSIVAFGVLWGLGVCLFVLGFLTVFISAAGFRILMLSTELTFVIGIILWLICMFKAYSGERWKLPIAGEMAERWVQS